MNIYQLRELFQHQEDYRPIITIIQIIEDQFNKGNFLKKYDSISGKMLNVIISVPFHINDKERDILFTYFIDKGILLSIAEEDRNTNIVLYDLNQHVDYKLGQKILFEREFSYKKGE